MNARMRSRILTFFAILSLLSLTVACGGGGGGSGGGSVTSSSSAESITPPISGTASVTLTWDAPTTDVNGDPLTDLDGYRVYYGTSSGSYSNSANIGNFTTATISNLSPGTWYITVTAYNTSGESGYATEVSVNL